MSLDYTLPEGMTNADLPYDGNEHFGFCIHMMVTGVPSLKGDGLDTFVNRIAEYAVASGNLSSENVMFFRDYAETVMGMTTNVSPMTDAQWKRKVYEIIQETAQKTLQNLPE